MVQYILQHKVWWYVRITGYYATTVIAKAYKVTKPQLFLVMPLVILIYIRDTNIENYEAPCSLHYHTPNKEI